MVGQVHVSVEGDTGWLRLDNPERLNAISLSMWRRLADGVASLVNDARVRAIVITGGGDKAFASGADISEFGDKRSDPESIAVYDEAGARALEAVATAPKPVIAVIRGWCLGGGLALALTCDMRIATEDARFAIPAARLGLGYDYGSLARLTAIVGPANARYILYTAERFDAQRALRMNLVNEVLAAGTFDERIAGLCAMLAENAPLTIAAAKVGIDAAIATDPRQGDRDRADAAVRTCFDSADYREGQRAFMEKRKPSFAGR